MRLRYRALYEQLYEKQVFEIKYKHYEYDKIYDFIHIEIFMVAERDRATTRSA